MMVTGNYIPQPEKALREVRSYIKRLRKALSTMRDDFTQNHLDKLLERERKILKQIEDNKA